mgnify:CR=1 FL=1|tara:strand:- start:701 stop:931 length:231 start_codon:yes stop_codon:yes gene_type:complete
MNRLGQIVDGLILPRGLPRAIVLKTDFPELDARKGAVFSRINGSPLWTMPGKQLGILASRVRSGLAKGEFEEADER